MQTPSRNQGYPFSRSFITRMIDCVETCDYWIPQVILDTSKITRVRQIAEGICQANPPLSRIWSSTIWTIRTLSTKNCSWAILASNICTKNLPAWIAAKWKLIRLRHTLQIILIVTASQTINRIKSIFSVHRCNLSRMSLRNRTNSARESLSQEVVCQLAAKIWRQQGR